MWLLFKSYKNKAILEKKKKNLKEVPIVIFDKPYRGRSKHVEGGHLVR